jgi:rRNA maturation endonuclease Nob1
MEVKEIANNTIITIETVCQVCGNIFELIIDKDNDTDLCTKCGTHYRVGINITIKKIN